MVTANIVDVQFPVNGVEAGFDRILSIEMFEHMRNYGLLLKKLSGWLKDDGKLFVHIFAHPLLAYPFENEGEADWMTRYFFTGGLMPSEHLLSHFQDDLKLERQWWVDGRHYGRTSNHWLAGMDANREAILKVLYPYDFFGEMALLDGLPRSATIKAVEPCHVFDSVLTRVDGTTIELTVREGSGDAGQVCTLIAQIKTTVVDLGVFAPGTYTIRAGLGDAQPVSVTID